MPSYPLTFPTNVAPESVKVRKVWPQARFDNPVDLTSQVQIRAGFRYEIDVIIQQMPADSAALWTQFFDDLQGGFGTFSFNLTPHSPGLTPAPGERTFRMATNQNGWDSKLAQGYGFAFTAIEAL